MFGIASIRQKEAVNLAKKIASSSISGILVGFPPYILPTQIEAVGYLKSIIESAQKPTILYDNPARTGFTLNMENIINFSKNPLVYGLKKAGNPNVVIELRRHINKDFLYFTRGEIDLWNKLEFGFNAVSSIGGNLYPTFVKDFINEYFYGNKEQAKESWVLLWEKISPLYQGSVFTNLKLSLKEQGLDVGIPRSPLGNK